MGIYFQPNTEQGLSRNACSKDQRKNQTNPKRAGSIGIMGHSNKNETGSNLINSVRKTATKNYTFTTVTNIPINQFQKNKTTNIDKLGHNPGKIPITLNTLLINGFDMKSNNGLSTQNIKKILSMGYDNYNSNTVINSGTRNNQSK